MQQINIMRPGENQVSFTKTNPCSLKSVREGRIHTSIGAAASQGVRASRGSTAEMKGNERETDVGAGKHKRQSAHCGANLLRERTWLQGATSEWPTL